jgi:membrane protein
MMISDPVIEWLGGTLGVETALTRLWSALRAPLAMGLTIAVLAALYYITPNVRRTRRALLSPGAALAILAALAVFWGFGLYLNVFDGASSYTKTYGALAAVVLVLFSMWLVNFMLLIGAEVDAQCERLRELAEGLPAEQGLLLPMRDDRGLRKRDARVAALAMASAEFRKRHASADAESDSLTTDV